VTTPLAKKLQMKTGMCALVIAAPPGYLKRLAPLPEGFSISSRPSGTYLFVQAFITRLAEIAKYARMFSRHAASDALVWLAYPKKTSGRDTDLSRDAIREKMSSMGWNAVSIVAIDEIWAALRFRPAKNMRADVKPFLGETPRSKNERVASKRAKP